MQEGEVTDARPASSKSQRTQLLLVEDDPHVLETLAELLELEGYGVCTAHDAVSALEELQGHGVSSVLCDLRLRGSMDGYGFARACRSNPRLAELHLIALSGYDGDEVRKRAMEAGFDCLLRKPMDLDCLCAAIKQERYFQADRENHKSETKGRRGR
jgi:CheY-like chemotaxis protein